MAFFLNDKEVEPNNEGCFDANCSVCFQDKHCFPITYPKIEKICAEFGIQPHSFAVCKDCFNMDKRSLQTNIMDYFVMDELYRWMLGEKDGIVKSDLEFRTLLAVAQDQGILYREEKRTRHRYTKQERVTHTGFVNMLKRQNDGDYTPSILYQSLFKKLYEG